VEALSELQREHRVEYLVVDRVNGDPANLGRILRHGTIVYDDPDLVIVRLTD
jgi:hypothetical protein